MTVATAWGRDPSPNPALRPGHGSNSQAQDSQVPSWRGRWWIIYLGVPGNESGVAKFFSGRSLAEGGSTAAGYVQGPGGQPHD